MHFIRGTLDWNSIHGHEYDLVMVQAEGHLLGILAGCSNAVPSHVEYDLSVISAAIAGNAVAGGGGGVELRQPVANAAVVAGPSIPFHQDYHRYRFGTSRP